ncbi:MAG: DUF6788 family protein [Acidobacteriota bacterium]
MKSPQKKNVERIKKRLADLGPYIPGSLSQQWNICGNPDCKCKDPVNPKKHGPYNQLSFSIRGKSSTFFIKNQYLDAVKLRIERYKVFKELCIELTRAYVDLARAEGFRESDK